MDALENVVGKLPPCVRVCLENSGYDSVLSLELLNERNINDIEKFMNEDKKTIQELTCCHSDHYKAQDQFQFLPGHRAVILKIPDLIKQLPINAGLYVGEQSRKNVSVVLADLIRTAEENSEKDKNNARYSDINKYFFTYIYLLCGKLGYETLNRNLPIPTTKTILRCINSNQKRINEGELRCKELGEYLDKLGTDRIVWISEDATAIVPKVSYDVVTNQIIGLALPIDKKTGCPLTGSFPATNADEIIEHMKKKKSTSVYVVMAQPLNDSLPPFTLQVFGTNNDFTAIDVMNRWRYTQSELAKCNIRVAGFSSDADSKLLSAMCQQVFPTLDGHNVTQDTIHIATKGRNRLLKPGIELKMGTHNVTVKHLKMLLKNGPKEEHGLNETDVSPNDRQNFASFEKIVSPRILNSLQKYVPESEGTVKYLQLLRDVISSYTEYDLDPSERVFRIWRSTYFIRIWREFIKSSKRYTFANHFITAPSFKAIEINARNMLSLIEKFRSENTPEYFLLTLFNSQTCEKFFRMLRAMGTVNFTKINFSILELLYMIRRAEVQNDILHFKLYRSGVLFPKFEVNTAKTKIYELPSEEKIKEVLKKALYFAQEDAKMFGMSLDENSLENYVLPYGIESDETDTELEEYEFEDSSEENINLDFDTSNSNENYNQYTEIFQEGGGHKIIRKSSLVWLLSEKGTKLSNDRLRRVQISKDTSLLNVTCPVSRKRARRTSEPRSEP